MEHAVRGQMDNEVGPDQLVALLDAQGASALQVTRKAQLCKDTAIALNKVAPLFLMHRHSVRTQPTAATVSPMSLLRQPFKIVPVPPRG